MKKMMLLAVMMAIAAMMLAAAPAFAQVDRVTICHVPPGNPGNAHTITIGAPAVAHHLANHPDDSLGACEDGQPGQPGDRDGDRDRDRFDEFDVFDEPFITQDIEQECESGDIDQSFDVSQTGDNSNQTVGLQGTANTGCAQNVTNVIDAGDFGDFDNDGFVFCDRDRDGNDDGDDDCEDFNDGFVICDFDNDGDNDECEDFNNNDDGFVFCDRDRDGKDDGDDECFVIFPDFNDGFFVNDGDRVFVNDGNDDGDIEIEDSGAEITLSPNNTTNSHQEVNQAAAASAPHWVWTASGWMWM